MYLWYFLVVVTSVIENFANTPFTESWTMRISRAPPTIRVNAPKVEGVEGGDDIIDVLKSGFNIKSVVTIDRSAPYSVPRRCFYAVIQKTGVSKSHAALRVFSKASSICVFAFGTTLFASSQLVAQPVTLMVLSLVLGAGVLGRITALFVLSEMNTHNTPIIHAVVQDRASAVNHLQEILDIPGLVVEVGGNIIVNGKCIRQRSQWLSWGRYIGLLAAPYDVTKGAIRVDNDRVERTDSNSDLEAGQPLTLVSA